MNSKTKLFGIPLFSAILAGVGILTAATNVQAQLVVTSETDQPPAPPVDTIILPNTAYTPTFGLASPSNSDLLQGANVNVIAQEGNFQREPTVTGLPALNDGAFDTVYGGFGQGPPSRAAYATFGDGGGATNPAGRFAVYDLGGAFDLTGINVFGGWLDGGRDQQNLVIAVSSDGITFTDIVPADSLSGNGDSLSFANGTANDTQRPISHLNVITDESGILATNVTQIRFSAADLLAGNDVENGYTGVAEIDVFGVASAVAVIPEPSSLALLGTIGLGIVARRRRR